MPSLSVSEAFEARLQQWPSLPSCPFVDTNVVSDVPKPPFVEIEYPVAAEDRMTVGARAVFRETGGARFVITVTAFKVGWKPQVLQWVEELRDLFRSVEFAGVETGEASPAVFDDRNKDGNRYRVPFVVTYTHDIIR